MRDCSPDPSCHTTVAESEPGSIRLTPGPGDELGSGGDGRPGEGVGHGAHAADGHPPLAGAVADQVVEEAPVLDQRRVVQRREGADQGIGGDHATDGVVLEALLDRLPERLADDVAPDAGVDRLSQLALEGERRHQGGRDRVGEVGHVGVELAPGVVLPVRARQGGERLARRLALRALDEQAAGSPVPGVRRVGGRRPGREPDVEVEVGHQLLGHETDEVGVARQPGRQPGERAHRDGGAAGVVEALENGHREARAGEVGGRDETVVAAADNGDVVAVLTGAHPSQRSRTGRARAPTCRRGPSVRMRVDSPEYTPLG